jgi:ribosomal protein L37E
LKRWACPRCGTHFEWYSKTCGSCGAVVPALEE